MIPIDMTTKHEPPDSVGDCFPCCIASILELPRAEVPHFYEGDGWVDESGKVGMKRLQEWLRPRGFHYVEFMIRAEHLPEWVAYLDGHYVFSGKSPRGHSHATVGLAGEMVHDPHPSRAGIAPHDDGTYQIGVIAIR